MCVRLQRQSSYSLSTTVALAIYLLSYSPGYQLQALHPSKGLGYWQCLFSLSYLFRSTTLQCDYSYPHWQPKKQAQGDEITQLLRGRPKLTVRSTPKSFIFFPLSHTHAHPAITHPPTRKPLSCAGSRTATRVRPRQQPSLLVMHVLDYNWRRRGPTNESMAGLSWEACFWPFAPAQPFWGMGPDRLTAGGVAGLQWSDWWYLLRFWYWMSFF